MKKSILFLFVVLLMASCSKQNSNDGLRSGGSNYPYLKSWGEHTLWAGQNINAGTVTYSLETIDGIDHVVVTYQCTGNWLITEWHIYIGDKCLLPRTNRVNGQYNPKVGRFPFGGYTDPVTTVSYAIALTPELIGSHYPFFIIAAHCVVINGTQEETAWAWGNHKFGDKSWGWFDDVSYWNNTEVPIKIVTEYNETTGHVVIDEVAGTNHNNLIDEEIEGIDNVNDIESVNYVNPTGLLYITLVDGTVYENNLNDDSPTSVKGSIGDPLSNITLASDGSFYYVNNTTHILWEITFEGGTMTSSPTSISISDLTVLDLEWNSQMENLYTIGTNSSGQTIVSVTKQNETGVWITSPLEDQAGAAIVVSIDAVISGVNSSVSGDQVTYAYPGNEAWQTVVLTLNSSGIVVSMETEEEVPDPLMRVVDIIDAYF